MATDNVHEAAVSKSNFPRTSKAMKKVMKKMLIAGMACVCGAALLAGCGGDSGSKSGGEKQFLNIATGGTAGTYYPLGGALAELLNNNIKGMNASAQSTGASVANVNMLKDGSVDLAFIHNDIAYYAVNGSEMFKDNKVAGLRGLAALYPETIQFVTTADKGIKSIADLKGKKVLGGRKGGMPEMVFEYILKQNGLDPQKDLSIDQSIDFGATAAAFTGDDSADFTVEFEPSATALEKQGAGYVVASLGVDSGYVPYTSYSAKTSYMEKNPDIMQKFTDALQKGMDYVQSHTPEEIAEVIEPQFPETDLDTITTIVKRYYDQDTWKENLVFGQDGFELLQDILEDAGELKERTPYTELVNTEFAQNAS